MSEQKETREYKKPALTDLGLAGAALGACIVGPTGQDTCAPGVNIILITPCVTGGDPQIFCEVGTGIT